jgi:hypothetical protein
LGLLTPPFNRSVTFSILEVFAKELHGKFCQDLVGPTYPKENLKKYIISISGTNQEIDLFSPSTQEKIAPLSSSRGKKSKMH